MVSEFPFNVWLEQGAIIGQVGQWVELFAGESKATAEASESVSPQIYFNDFFLQDSKPWKSFPYHCRLSWNEWLAKVQSQKGNEVKNNIQWSIPDKIKFSQSFADIQTKIQQGKLQKAVPVVYESADKTAMNIYSLLQNPVAGTFLYGFWQQQKGILGYTPEILFERQSPTHLKTMALAGTCEREKFLTQQEEFLNNAKESKEHQIVVEDIQNRLSPMGKIEVLPRTTQVAGDLVHLLTPLELECRTQIDFLQIVKVLHPTSALGVMPISMMDDLKQWRPQHLLLGAPIGIRWSADKFLCLVAIRNLQWDENSLYLGSGCGVVAESQMEQEWHELHLKRKTVKKSLGL